MDPEEEQQTHGGDCGDEREGGGGGGGCVGHCRLWSLAECYLRVDGPAVQAEAVEGQRSQGGGERAVTCCPTGAINK